MVSRSQGMLRSRTACVESHREFAANTKVYDQTELWESCVSDTPSLHRVMMNWLHEIEDDPEVKHIATSG